MENLKRPTTRNTLLESDHNQHPLGDDSSNNSDTEGDSESDDSSDSSDGEEHINEGGQDSSNPSKKSGRGHARLDDKWGDGNKKLQIMLNCYNQPIRENADTLSTRLGILARDGENLPLTYHDWRKIPKENKEKAWLNIKANHEVDDAFKPVCMKILGKRWRDFKYELKVKCYKEYKTNEERLKHRDLRVEEDQWPELISYWSTPTVKKICKGNRKTRKAQKMVNTSGRKSHARVRDEILQNTGREPSKMDVYIATRKKKNGDPVDDETAETFIKFNELLNEEPEDSRSEESVKNRIFDQVMGPEKAGRVRTYGLGPTPSQVLGLSSKHTGIEYRSMEETIKSSVRETVIEQYREEILEDIRQGAFIEKLREELRGEIRQEVREEIREEVRQEECDKLRHEIRGEMEFMMQEMMRSRFDEMRRDQSHTIPSINTQVPDASSAHRLTSNNDIGLEQIQLPQANSGPNTNGCQPHQHKTKKKQTIDGTQDKAKKNPRINEKTWEKIYNAKNKKKQNDGINNHGEVFVDLLDYKGPKIVVARGVLVCEDAAKIVGGHKLGKEFSEVLIKDAIKPTERLIRPYEGVTILGEAIGKSIAWRSIDVIPR